MANIRELHFSSSDWETRYILEALFSEMQRLKEINATSTDEDEAADAGNDFLEVSGLYDRMSKEAVSVFGEQILNFNREPI